VGFVIVAAVVAVGFLSPLVNGDRIAFDRNVAKLVVALILFVIIATVMLLVVRLVDRSPVSAMYPILRVSAPRAKIFRIVSVIESAGLDFGEVSPPAPMGFLVLEPDKITVWSGDVEAPLLYQSEWAVVSWLASATAVDEDVVHLVLGGRSFVAKLQARKGGAWLAVKSNDLDNVRAKYLNRPGFRS
jgi:hypothetical protein